MSKTDLQITIYEKQNSKSFITLLKEGIINIFKSNYLAFQLAKRDISAQYRQSFLGIIWSILLPLSTAILWVFLKSSNTVALEDTGMNYTLYVFIGTMAWAILTESVMGPINSTLSMRNTLSKINFPKEALITSSIYKNLFNLGVKLLVLVVLLVFFKQSVGLNLLFFPFALFVILFFGTTFGVLITPLGLLYGDVNKLMGPIMQILMYVSPVVFAIPKSKVGVYNTIVHLNPMNPLINNFRNTLLSQPLEQLNYYMIIFGISSIFFCMSLVIFKITIPIITERISA